MKEDRISHYRVIEQIGAGGMGKVFLAEDTRLGRKVALKLLPAEFTRDADRVRRFVQEAKAASALNHPNILTIYEIGQADSSHYIATEFIEGRTLRRHGAADRAKLSAVLDIALQIGSALAAAHRAGIIHRDIKPDNVMVRPDGYVKVLDFGLAKLTERFPKPETGDLETPTDYDLETNSGMILGTASYMSPEQARGQKVDHRSDIFSFGVVLYELLTGTKPFSGPTVSHTIVSILESEPPSLARHLPPSAGGLDRIVAKALAKDRAARYQSVEDLLADLRRVKQRVDFEAELQRSGSSNGHSSEDDTLITSLAGKASVSHTTRHMSSAEYIFGEIKRHKRAAILALALVLLAAAALTYYLVSRSRAIDSIAVLPLVNVGAEPSAEQLGDKITENLINNLSQLAPKLRVAPRSLVVGYKGREVDVRQVGRDLGVRAVLTGRVQQRGDTLNIQVDLVDVENLSQLWGHQYERKLSDSMLVQDEVSSDIFKNLRLRLSVEEAKKLEAYSHYLKGRNHLNKRTAAALEQAIAHFRHAVERDPGFAPAYAGLADCYNMLVVYGVKRPNEAFPMAKEAAEKALEIDDSLAEAHTSLGFLRGRWEWNWAEAEHAFQTAVRNKPTYAPAHQWFSSFLVAMGRFNEALGEAKRAQELEPLSLIAKSHLAWIHYMAGQPEQAVAVCRKLIEMDPNFFPAHRYLGLAYSQQGRHAEAIAAFERARKLSGSSLIVAHLGYAYAAAGEREKAAAVLAELQQLSARTYVSPYTTAAIHAALGEKDRAFEWLEKAFEERDLWLMNLRVDPALAPLHSDARFAALLRRIKLS
jgi:eukaryotic-like serine/threonine-protein kinase